MIAGRPARRLAVETVAALLGAVLVTALPTWLAEDATVRGDQQHLNLIVQKRLDPSILSRDALYGTPAIALYTPSFIDLQAAVARRHGGDPLEALRVLAWPLGILFLLGHYVLFRVVTGSPLAGALGAASALTVRHALAGEYWGFDALRSVQPRSIVAALVPALLLLFLRWRERPGFPLYFLGLGLLVNVHPVSAFHLAQVTGVGHLGLARFRPRAIRQVAAGAALFVLGSLPLLLLIRGGREHVTDPAALALVREALHYRFGYTLFPITGETLVSLAFHAGVLVVVTGYLLWRRQAGADLERLLALAGVAVLLALGGTAVVQAAGLLTDRPYVDVLQMRAAKLAYPALLTALAVAYGRLLQRRSVPAYAGLALLFLISLVSPAAVIHASPELRGAAKRALGLPVAAEAPAAPGDSASERRMWEWVRISTPADALFFTDLDGFRVGAGRSITGTFKDGGWLFLGGTRPFHEWYLYMRDVERCRAQRGRECWFHLGDRHGADYVVVDPGVPESTPPPGFERAWAEGGWAVWRRKRAS